MLSQLRISSYSLWKSNLLRARLRLWFQFAEQLACLEASQSCLEGLDVIPGVVVVHNQMSVLQFEVENDSSDPVRIESGLNSYELHQVSVKSDGRKEVSRFEENFCFDLQFEIETDSSG